VHFSGKKFSTVSRFTGKEVGTKSIHTIAPHTGLCIQASEANGQNQKEQKFASHFVGMDEEGLGILNHIHSDCILTENI